MSILAKLEQLRIQARENRWMRYFTIGCRLLLALGFLPSGFVKIMGERFTALSSNHPMGHYLEALHHTGYYYTFIGIAQVTAALLLLIPHTALLGALLYFPIILNIFILSWAVRFDGSFLTSPLMVLADLYLLCWDYDRLKFIFPLYQPARIPIRSNKFPIRFFAAVFATMLAVALTIKFAYNIKPRNTEAGCLRQCATSSNPQACETFCNCIHKEGRPLDSCLSEYNKALRH